MPFLYDKLIQILYTILTLAKDRVVVYRVLQQQPSWKPATVTDKKLFQPLTSKLYSVGPGEKSKIILFATMDNKWHHSVQKVNFCQSTDHTSQNGYVARQWQRYSNARNSLWPVGLFISQGQDCLWDLPRSQLICVVIFLNLPWSASLHYIQSALDRSNKRDCG